MVAQEFMCAGLKHTEIVSEPGEINDPSFFWSKAEDLDFNVQSIFWNEIVHKG